MAKTSWPPGVTCWDDTAFLLWTAPTECRIHRRDHSCYWPKVHVQSFSFMHVNADLNHCALTQKICFLLSQGKLLTDWLEVLLSFGFDLIWFDWLMIQSAAGASFSLCKLFSFFRASQVIIATGKLSKLDTLFGLMVVLFSPMSMGHIFRPWPLNSVLVTVRFLVNRLCSQTNCDCWATPGDWSDWSVGAWCWILAPVYFLKFLR